MVSTIGTSDAVYSFCAYSLCKNAHIVGTICVFNPLYYFSGVFNCFCFKLHVTAYLCKGDSWSLISSLT